MVSAQSLRSSDRQHQSEVGLPGLNDAADKSPESGARLRWPKSNASRGSSRLESDRPVSKSPGIGKRLLRAIFRFALAILIGVAGTLSWQSYGDKVQDMVRARAPSLDWLIPPATTKSATANARSAELTVQLKPIALDLAVVRKAVEQLAANQEQLAAKDGEITQSIAALQATEQQLGDKISSLPAPKTAHIAPRRAPQHPPQPLNLR
jgi:hypothetical protein